MSTYDARRAASSTGRKLQFVLLLLIVWEVLALVAEIAAGSPFFKLEADEATGWLAAKGSFSGAAVVPLACYVYALVRGPLRHRSVFWLAAVEQAATALFAVFHVATGILEVEGLIAPLAVSLGLLFVVLVNFPRGPVSASV
jgi:hypothetical protein